MQKLSPILIVGSARNGTTFLVNQLSSYENVTCAAHNVHHGSIESNIERNKRKWGDISNANNYIQMLSTLMYNDYFYSLGFNPEDYMEKKYNHFFDFFLDFMDDCASKSGSKYWVTKIDPNLFLSDSEMSFFFTLIFNRYSNSHVIVLQRNFKDSLKSYLYMAGKKSSYRFRYPFRTIAILTQTIRYFFLYSSINKLNIENKYSLRFEDLINSKDLRSILKIDNLGKKSKKRFDVNTSFSNNKKVSSFNFFDKLAIKAGLLIGNIRMSKTFLRIYRYLTLNERKDLEHYRIIKLKYFRRELINDLKSENENQLLEQRTGNL